MNETILPVAEQGQYSAVEVEPNNANESSLGQLFAERGVGDIHTYNASLRFLMAVSGLLLAFPTVIMLAISPIMFAFMHDDPKTMEFPGNMWAIFAFLIYLGLVGMLGLYSWTLMKSAMVGATVFVWGNPSRTIFRSSSSLCGVGLLLPAVLMLTAFLWTST